MKPLDLHTVEEKLNTITAFLSPCLSLANGHATDFITKKYWDSFIPKCIQDELLSLTREQLNTLPCTGRLAPWKQVSRNSSVGPEIDSCQKDDRSDHETQNKHSCTDNELQDEWVCSHNVATHIKSDTDTQADCMGGLKSKLAYSSIAEYCTAAEACTIDGLGLAVTPDVLLKKFDVVQNDLFIGTFMSEKKCHEIEVMSKVCSSIARRYKCKLVIDFGSGKGYLGKHLSLLYKIPVLGIDAVNTYTQSAEQRSAVLDKQWPGLTRNAEHKLEGKKLSKKEKKLSKNKDNLNAGKRDKVNAGYREKVNTGNKGYDSRSQAVAPIDSNKNIDVSSELNGGELNVNTNIGINHDISNNAETITDSDNFEQKQNTEMHANFVPCTCYIDKNTNFMQLADQCFPYLFSSYRNHKNTSSQSHNFSEHSTCDCHIDSSNQVDKNMSAVREHDGTCVCPCGSCKSSSEKSSRVEDSHTVLDEKMSYLCGCMSLKERTTSASNSVKESLCMKCSSNEESMCMKCSSNEESMCLKCSSNEDPSTQSDRLKLMLVGLHTCGNLASTSVELFVNNDQLSVLCNVGCCYHLIEEKYAEDSAVNIKGASDKKSGFPLSTCLNQKKFSVGNTARNLASQAVYRVPEFEQLQGERFYPRALLEVLLQDVEGKSMEPRKGLRGLEKKSKCTKDYLRRACDKLNISDKISDEMLDVYMRRYQPENHRLAAFFQLKTVLAPCIESLIILDRVAFLLEQDNINEVYLVKMFDPVISPRCYSIVAIKK